VAARFSLDETFDVGEDTGTPVVEDYAAKMPYPFTGTLRRGSNQPSRQKRTLRVLGTSVTRHKQASTPPSSPRSES
jgi:hypothetical protein